MIFGIFSCDYLPFIYLYLRFHLFSFREKGREGEREGEKHDVKEKYPSVVSLTHDRGPNRNPDMCRNGESNQRPLDTAGQCPTN